jgi:predicted nucleotidyltransferase
MLGPIRELLRGTSSQILGNVPDPTGRHVARRFASAARAVYGQRLRGVYLYGSRARGDHRPDSDVDVLIVLDRIDDYAADLRRSSEAASSLSIASGLTITRLLVTEEAWGALDRPIIRAAAADAVRA